MSVYGESTRGGRFWKSRSKCSHCHKPGHTRDVCYILHGPSPNYDPIVLKEYNEFLQYRESKHTSPPIAYGAKPNQPSNTAFNTRAEYDKFLQYGVNKQTSPQVVSVAQRDVSIAGNSFACVAI